MNPKILDLWERRLKLEARMAEASLIKGEIAPLLSGSSGYTTIFREKIQNREQNLLREYQSVCAFLKAEENKEDE